MSLSRRCDVCDTRYGNWKIRKRWRIFETVCYGGDCMDFTMDFCDKCFKKFQEWATKER